MKPRFIIYSILAAATVALSACDGNEDVIGVPVEAQFYAELPSSSATRSDKSSFAANDQIGITGCYSDNGTTKIMNSANMCYYNDNTGGNAWKPNGDDNKFVFKNSSTVTFSAYYPYSSDVSDNVLKIDGTKDILYATATGGASSNVVSFKEFSHTLSKLTFTFTAGDGMTTSKIQNLSFTVSGLVKSGTFNTLTGKAASSGSTTTDITLSTGTSLTASTNAIPQVATITLKLSYSGSTYSVSLGSVTLTGGNEYCYNITVKKYEVLACSSSITSWSNGASSTIASSKVLTGSLISSQNAGDFRYSDGSYDSYSTTLTAAQKSACTGIYIGKVNNKKRYITYVSSSEVDYKAAYNINDDLATSGDCNLIYENLSRINLSLSQWGSTEILSSIYWIYTPDFIYNTSSLPEEIYFNLYNFSTGKIDQYTCAYYVGSNDAYYPYYRRYITVGN